MCKNIFHRDLVSCTPTLDCYALFRTLQGHELGQIKKSLDYLWFIAWVASVQDNFSLMLLQGRLYVLFKYSQVFVAIHSGSWFQQTPTMRSQIRKITQNHLISRVFHCMYSVFFIKSFPCWTSNVMIVINILFHF